MGPNLETQPLSSDSYLFFSTLPTLSNQEFSNQTLVTKLNKGKFSSKIIQSFHFESTHQRSKKNDLNQNGRRNGFYQKEEKKLTSAQFDQVKTERRWSETTDEQFH